ncbi:putative Heterodimeric geranylgeranyl pyrophosphate synthase small subunit, chloroplastic [Cocos nucifera]|uniref:Putative Heterodimeric geranylgeranyl pyrophosphate synthase small subunit, chloroplastic n=1 Tax=Cocos nucifera TaxID=13894 RepID=A0A8K0HVR2_COCNU|nr:putative Heterodimeric geranylgeranyl pyrophosphate synthase small subunit, chloroplastic [Cocos nucifera]
MCIAVYELVDGDCFAAFPIVCALEMVLVASLVHDDFSYFDAAPLYRSLPSTHACFNNDMAILADDALFPIAFSHIIASTLGDLIPSTTILHALVD